MQTSEVNNMVDVMIQLDKEARKYKCRSSSFGCYIAAINSILEDCDDDLFDIVVLKVSGLIEAPIDFNADVVKSLDKRGYSFSKARLMYDSVSMWFR